MIRFIFALRRWAWLMLLKSLVLSVEHFLALHSAWSSLTIVATSYLWNSQRSSRLRSFSFLSSLSIWESLLQSLLWLCLRWELSSNLHSICVFVSIWLESKFLSIFFKKNIIMLFVLSISHLLSISLQVKFLPLVLNCFQFFQFRLSSCILLFKDCRFESTFIIFWSLFLFC